VIVVELPDRAVSVGPWTSEVRVHREAFRLAESYGLRSTIVDLVPVRRIETIVPLINRMDSGSPEGGFLAELAAAAPVPDELCPDGQCGRCWGCDREIGGAS
jgi:hypothetical protein